MRSAIKFIIVLVLAVASPAFNCLAVTAQEVLRKAAATAGSAKGISGTFTISGRGNGMSGTLKASGNRFSLVTPAASTWYNGKNMWTYNSSSRETTLIVPTSAELAEINPMMYLKSYSSEYVASFSKNGVKGSYVVTLSPKSRKSVIKSVEVTVNSKSWKPVKFVITGKDNSRTTVSVKTLSYSSATSPADFEYPKSRFKGVPVIDLR